jgi:2-polyprenyl-3-methyl-5-hydroxy-6-metoxy-1,4-benzoquinol methylase
MSEHRHVCPVWTGFFLASPMRRLVQNPQKMLCAYVRPGMTVLDFGCAMGFFSLPLARMVGQDGRVLCVDCQQGMLKHLERRARKAELGGRIDARVSNGNGYGLEDVHGTLDFALAYAVVHEVPDTDRLMHALYAALRPGAQMLLGEPVSHVRAGAFRDEQRAALQAGFEVAERPRICRSHAVVLQKPG